MKIIVTRDGDHLRFYYNPPHGEEETSRLLGNNLKNMMEFQEEFMKDVEFDPPEIKNRMLNSSSYMELLSSIIYIQMQHAEKDMLIQALTTKLPKVRWWNPLELLKWLYGNRWVIVKKIMFLLGYISSIAVLIYAYLWLEGVIENEYNDSKVYKVIGTFALILFSCGITWAVFNFPKSEKH